MADDSSSHSNTSGSSPPYEPLYPSLDRPSSSSSGDFEEFAEASTRHLQAGDEGDLRQQVARRLVQDAVAYFGLQPYTDQLGPMLDSLAQQTDSNALDRILRAYAQPLQEGGDPGSAAEQLKELFRHTALQLGREQVVRLLGNLSSSAQNPTIAHVVRVADTFVAEEFTMEDMPLMRQIVQLCPVAGSQRTPTAAELQNVSALLMPKVTHFVSQTASGRQLMLDSMQAFATTPLAGFISSLLTAAAGVLHHASSALSSVASSAAAVSAAAQAAGGTAAPPLLDTDGPLSASAVLPSAGDPQQRPAAPPEASV
eukprot:GGOE01047547.1.p1 GENE.GGOE01047547.1~~GGOE01047547.1.p1  ORF type:complete len:327 (+),score=103.46 GGOE01047547.1:47-982(+)